MYPSHHRRYTLPFHFCSRNEVVRNVKYFAQAFCIGALARLSALLPFHLSIGCRAEARTNAVCKEVAIRYGPLHCVVVVGEVLVEVGRVGSDVWIVLGLAGVSEDGSTESSRT